MVEGGTGNAIKETLRMQTMTDIESGKKNLRRHRSGLAEGDKGKKQTGEDLSGGEVNQCEGYR